MNRLVQYVFLIAAGLTATGPVLAHAHLTRAFPSPNATVKSAPSEISLQFSEAVSATSSGVEILNSEGEAVPVESMGSAPGDKRTLLVTPAGPLGPGTYEVIWHAVTINKDKTQGSYSFTIQP
jgi:copper resistance protein C